MYDKAPTFGGGFFSYLRSSFLEIIHMAATINPIHAPIVAAASIQTENHIIEIVIRLSPLFLCNSFNLSCSFVHDINRPWSIGHFLSQGCIRLRNKDIEELFEWVPVGTPVRIEAEEFRNQRTLQYEALGADVVQLQVKLKKLGYLEGRADGFFSKDTEEAVKRFQHDNKLKVTGVADQKIFNLLGL